MPEYQMQLCFQLKISVELTKLWLLACLAQKKKKNLLACHKLAVT
jgi:hypothetical protein